MLMRHRGNNCLKIQTTTINAENVRTGLRGRAAWKLLNVLV